MESISNVKKLTRASMLLVFALIVIYTGSRAGGAVFNSFIVGPLVNSIILVTVMVADLKFGIIVALCTPVLAALTGQLAAPMVPFSPFIMFGNAIYAAAFGLFAKNVKTYGSIAGIGAGSLLKALWLMMSVKFLVPLFKVNIPKPALAKLSVVMSYPQFITALAGGVIAMAFYSIFIRFYSKAR